MKVDGLTNSCGFSCCCSCSCPGSCSRSCLSSCSRACGCSCLGSCGRGRGCGCGRSCGSTNIFKISKLFMQKKNTQYTNEDRLFFGVNRKKVDLCMRNIKVRYS